MWSIQKVNLGVAENEGCLWFCGSPRHPRAEPLLVRLLLQESGGALLLRKSTLLWPTSGTHLGKLN